MGERLKGDFRKFMDKSFLGATQRGLKTGKTRKSQFTKRPFQRSVRQPSV